MRCAAGVERAVVVSGFGGRCGGDIVQCLRPVCCASAALEGIAGAASCSAFDLYAARQRLWRGKTERSGACVICFLRVSCCRGLPACQLSLRAAICCQLLYCRLS